MRYQTPWRRSIAAAAIVGIAITAAALLAACGGGNDPAQTELRLTIDPPVLVARQNESVMLRVDVPDVADADLPSGYAFDLDEAVGKIDVTTAPCPAGEGSRACQDWTLTPHAGSLPGHYDVSVRTSGSRAGIGYGDFELTVVDDPAPAFGAAVAVAASSRHVLVRNDAGRIFTMGDASSAQSRAGYRRLPMQGLDFAQYGTEVFEPNSVSEFVEAPLPAGRWIGIDAVPHRSFAVRDDGSVWAWGDNSYGAFGFPPVGASPLEPSPRQLPGLAGVRALSVGQQARNPSYALRADGTVLVWQADVFSPMPACELYTNRPRAGLRPLDPCDRIFSGVRAIARSARSEWNVSSSDWPDGIGFDFLLKNDGSVWSPAKLEPVALAGMPSPPIAIALDADSNLLALDANGQVWLREPNQAPQPQPVAGLSDVVALSARPSAPNDVFALRRDGTVWTWIVGAPAPAGTPQPIAGLSDVVELGAHYAISGECIVGGALWRIDRHAAADNPKAVRVPGFGEGPGCSPGQTIEVAIGVRGRGRVVSAPVGIACGSSCVARFARAGELQLHAAPAAGWRFYDWVGDARCTSERSALTSDVACTAVFVQTGERRLGVRIDGQGSVTSDPAGIDCRDDCAQAYDVDTTVTLSATPALGWGFERFVGIDDCADGTLTMDRVKHCVALFEPLAAPPAPTGFTATALGTSVQLHWNASAGVVERYGLERADASGVFEPIAGAIGGSATGFIDQTTAPATAYTYRLFAINSRGASPAASAGATTGATPAPTLDVSIAGTGSGSVMSDPGDIACGADCSETFTSGTTVTLHADGNFAGWQGCDSVSGNHCTVTLNGSRHVSASFDANVAPRWLLRAIKQGIGAIVSTPAGIACGLVCITDFADGSVVTLSGSAQFAGADGCDTIVGNQCTVTMDRSRSVLFRAAAPVTVTLTVHVDLAGGFVGTTDGLIGCSTTATNRCSASYLLGTQVGVYAAALPGAAVTFQTWQGDCAGIGLESSLTVTMDRNRDCRAVFVAGQ